MTNMTCPLEETTLTQGQHPGATANPPMCASGSAQPAASASSQCTSGHSSGAESTRRTNRGLTSQAPATVLRTVIRVRALGNANRFRVIRTIDVAAACFPEREYKAALTAAQRAMRGMVKAALLRRYRTDRFQTVYGLTQLGAEYLQEVGVEASASVRRVSDMTNPEHRLWAQFLVLCAEARGLRAWTEIELLRLLNLKTRADQPTVQGPLRVQVSTPKGVRPKVLRPDALVVEPDGATWVEVDRSARGSERAADLRALALSVGATLLTGHTLCRVAVFTRSARIHHRVLALIAQLTEQTARAPLVLGRRQLRESAPGEYEVWETRNRDHGDGRASLVDALAGHVVVQTLPTWLPKVRLDGRGNVSTAGWFRDNYLPYRRPLSLSAWESPGSPLLRDAGLSPDAGNGPR